MRNRDRRSSAGDDTLRDVRRTRASALWVTTGIAVVLLLALAIFIAQNSQSAEVHFLGADGSVPLAVGFLFSAVAGALVVLLAGAIRVVQLRRAGRRHLKADRSVRSSAPPAGVESQPVEAQRHPDDARP